MNNTEYENKYIEENKQLKQEIERLQKQVDDLLNSKLDIDDIIIEPKENKRIIDRKKINYEIEFIGLIDFEIKLEKEQQCEDVHLIEKTLQDIWLYLKNENYTLENKQKLIDLYEKFGVKHNNKSIKINTMKESIGYIENIDQKSINTAIHLFN